MSSRYVDWCRHIIENVDRIESYVGDATDPLRLETPVVADAVERCLERISEACQRFHRSKVELGEWEPLIPWRDIRAFGNIVRHEYDQVDEQLIRDTILAELPKLRAAAMRLLERFSQ